MLNAKQDALCAQSEWDFSGLRALFINCTLKRSPAVSHTQGLADVALEILRKNRVQTDSVRLVDHTIAFGVYPDMTEHGWPKDEWPAIYPKVKAADILIIGAPIWLGEKSSVCSMLIERLYAMSAQLNDKGQYAYYGKVGGCIITGNEDGVKHCSMNILSAYNTWATSSRRRPMPVGSARPGPGHRI
ncbi:MAG: NAD(P)H-dependent oxidoreductase [Hyphomicrobium sp.]